MRYLRTQTTTFFILVLFFLYNQYSYAQNVGIGATNPVERLDVDGAIKIGSTSQSIEGTIQWDGTIFSGYDGNDWKKFGESVPSGSLIMSQTLNNEFLQNGYSYFGKTEQQFAQLEEAAQGWKVTETFNASAYNAIWLKTQGDTLFVLSERISDAKMVLNIYDAVTNTWSLASTNITPDYRQDFAIDISEEYIIYFGGADGFGNPSHKDSYIYDIANDNWVATTATNSPATNRKNSILTIIGNQFYLYGGEDGSGNLNETYKYNISTSSWTSINAIVGMNNLDPDNYLESHFITPAGWLIYNNSITPSLHYLKFSSEIWANRSMLSGPQERFEEPLQMGNDIVIWGSSDINDLSKGFIFHFNTSSWSKISNLNSPGEIYSFSRIVSGDSLYLFGGILQSGPSISNEGFIYNKITNMWMSMTMPVGDIGMYRNYTTLINNKIFTYGGQYDLANVSGEGALYDIQSNTWAGVASIPPIGTYYIDDPSFQQIFNLSNEIIIPFPEFFDNNLSTNTIDLGIYRWCLACLTEDVALNIHYYVKN